MNENQREKLAVWLTRIQEELDRVIDFWIKNSHDLDYGGFFTCLDKDGGVFDENKHIWLQSRQVWMYMRLYNEVERYRNNKEIYEAAVKGADFILSKCLVQQGGGCWRCPLLTTKDGKAIKFQRNLFSECFFVMAMTETWRATGGEKYKDSAITVINQIHKWCTEDDSDLGRESLPGIVPTSSLAIPMMALCLCQQMEESSLKWGGASSLESWAVDRIFLHVQRNGERILENVSSNGKELSGSIGRLQNPGHAIECGWFLLEYCRRRRKTVLTKQIINQFIDAPFRQGWDVGNGGLLYFIDADGRPPLQLEWNMKLWWPQNEAMIAFLMAFSFSKYNYYLDNFFMVSEYAFNKFSDPIHGEWFGYLNRKGEISTQLKGGPWKGCFHVPRCLFICEKIIKELLQ